MLGVGTRCIESAPEKPRRQMTCSSPRTYEGYEFPEVKCNTLCGHRVGFAITIGELAELVNSEDDVRAGANGNGTDRQAPWPGFTLSVPSLTTTISQSCLNRFQRETFYSSGLSQWNRGACRIPGLTASLVQVICIRGPEQINDWRWRTGGACSEALTIGKTSTNSDG